MMFSGKNGTMPGPAMASRMMQMMPMMAGGMLSECSGEDRSEYIVDMVCRLVAQGSEGMTGEEYEKLVQTISRKLAEGPEGTPAGSGGCC